MPPAYTLEADAVGYKAAGEQRVQKLDHHAKRQWWADIDEEDLDKPSAPMQNFELGQPLSDRQLSGAAASKPCLSLDMAIESDPDPRPRWNSLSSLWGELSTNGHVIKIHETSVGQQMRKHKTSGALLAPMCTLFENQLRSHGVNQYVITVVNGLIGKADGVGFVFDSEIRRNNIQKMRSVFLSSRGCICIRNRGTITKLSNSMPNLKIGVPVRMTVDLDNAMIRYQMFDSETQAFVVTDVNYGPYFDWWDYTKSGFLCAVLTNSSSLSLF